MRLLILGGTIFLGRHLGEAATARGHEVTLFNRGQSRPDAFEHLERLRGDRDGDLTALAGRSWDAVIDTCGYLPSTVRRSAELLDGAVGHYTFISSISVYDSHPAPGIDESAPVGELTDEQLAEAEKIDPGERATAKSFQEFYGPLKARCERTLEEAMPGRVLTVRPGLIVGPHDYSDRFPYWVRRVAKGGEVLAPGRRERRIRMVDGRDLAEWTVRAIEAGTTGIYNATGSVAGWTMEEVLAVCRAASASDASFTWVDQEFLVEHDVGPWIELPLWLPEEHEGFFAVRNDKAIAAGLTFRDLAATAGDTLAWDLARSADPEWKTGLTPEREEQLLQLFGER